MRWRIILLIMGLAACSSEEKPENLIDEGTMANIMTDVHMIEAQINNMRLQHQDSSVYVYQKLKVKMLKKYKVDTAVFNTSFKYYILNPDKMKPIYAEVKKKLEDIKKKTMEASKAKTSAKSPVKSSASIIDSLKKIKFLPKRVGKNIP
jgi:Domain of unknown function (DUF4296)